MQEKSGVISKLVAHIKARVFHLKLEICKTYFIEANSKSNCRRVVLYQPDLRSAGSTLIANALICDGSCCKSKPLSCWTFHPISATVKTLYSDILYNSNILYNVNCICTNVKFSLNLNSLQQKFSLTSNYLRTVS